MKKHFHILILLFSIHVNNIFCQNATYFTFTGNQIDLNILKNGVEYSPTKKILNLQQQINVNNVSYKTIKSNEFAAVIGNDKTQVCIPISSLSKLEEGDEKALTLLSFALLICKVHSGKSVNTTVIKADQALIKFASEKLMLSKNEIVSLYNKLLDEPLIVNYPNKQVRLDLISKHFSQTDIDKPVKTIPEKSNKENDSNGDDEEISTISSEDCELCYINNTEKMIEIEVTLSNGREKQIIVNSGNKNCLYSLTPGVYPVRIFIEGKGISDQYEVKLEAGERITKKINN